ncbi:MAG TPA: hypothetical protein VFH88_14130, partial [Candidatus Krumholzibacteria bacterium]|nr:hypothetical protein [Candidatus Krumholzibacteria bacterium]
MAKSTRIRPAVPPVLAGEVEARRIFAREWLRRTRTVAKIARRADGDLSHDDVHDLRVTTRRL